MNYSQILGNMRVKFKLKRIMLLFIFILTIYAQVDYEDTDQIRSVNIINCRADNYTDRLHLIKLSSSDSWILLIGSSIALVIQLSFVLLTFKVPRLKAQPGDILLGAFCAEILLSIHWLMTSIESLAFPNTHVHQEDPFCIVNSIVSIIGTSLQGLYNFAFFLFIGFSIKNSLRASSISRKKTHFIIIGLSMIFLASMFILNMNGKTLYGTCSYVSDESFPMASILLYFLFLCFAIIILIYFNHKIPNTTFYKKKRKEFLFFARLYLSFCLVMWGLIAISNTVLFLNCQYFHIEELVNFQTIGNAAKVISSIILPLIRLKDPYLKSIIKQQQKILKTKIQQKIQVKNNEEKPSESCVQMNQTSSINTAVEQKNQTIITNSKSDSHNSSFDFEGIINFGQSNRNHSQKQDQMQRLSQRYKDQRTKLSSFDDLKFIGSIIPNHQKDGDQLSQQEIEDRLAIFDNDVTYFPFQNSASQKNNILGIRKQTKITEQLPPILSATSNISNSTRKESNNGIDVQMDESHIIHKDYFGAEFQMQYSKPGQDQFFSQQTMSLNVPVIVCSNGITREKSKEVSSSVDQDMSFSFIKKEIPGITQTVSIMQPPSINVIKPEDKQNGLNQPLESPINYSKSPSTDIPLNFKLVESQNNIRQRKKLSIFYKSKSSSKDRITNSYLNSLDRSTDSSKIFLSRRHEFRKTLNQETIKKRLHSKLFDYMKQSSMHSELMGSQYNEQQLKEEDIIFQEKLNEMIKNAHMMDYFHDPYYKFNSQSQSGSFTDIDQIFGNESTSSGSSINQNNLQAENTESTKDHFIRILQRNIKMGVLSRILCGIQIHFMRKKRYCTKVDIFSDTYSSLFNCKINSVKLNKNSSAISSYLPSIRPSKTGIYDQFQTLPDNQAVQKESQTKIPQSMNGINECDISKEFNEDIESPPPRQVICSQKILEEKNNQVVSQSQLQQQYQQQQQQLSFSRQNSQFNKQQQQQQFQLESVFNRQKSEQYRRSFTPKSKEKSYSLNLREVERQLTRVNKSKINSGRKQKQQDQNEIFYEVKIYQFSDDSIKSNLQHAPSQLLDSDPFDLVRMRVYAPTVFHSLQQTEIILLQNQEENDPDKSKNVIDIEKSFNIQHNMTQIKNASGSDGGKSGQFFFFSHDNKFLLKTISEKELKILIERLPSYFHYLKSNPRSLIAKIFGVYTFEGLNENPIHLVLMKNIAACTKQFIERTYDLKGSTFDREVLPKTKKQTESFTQSLNKMILKDTDFKNLEKKMYITLEDRHKIYAQLRKDAEFLRSCGWIDYSLIVFKINRKRHTEWKETCQVTYMEEEEDLDSQLSNYYQFESSAQRGIFYHIGIIDYLQLYDMQKRLEKYAKRIIHFSPSLDTSSQDAETYSKRFIQFMKQILEI